MGKIEVTNMVEIRTNIRLDEVDLIPILTEHFGLRTDASIDISFYQDSLELSHVVRDVKRDELAEEDSINKSFGGKTFLKEIKNEYR